MKRIFRWVTFLIALLTVFTVFGCDSNDDKEDEPTPLTNQEWNELFAQEKFHNVCTQFTYINRELGDIQCMYSRIVDGNRYSDNVQIEDDSIFDLINTIRDSYGKFKLENLDLYTSSELEINGYGNVRVSFSDDGLSSVNMTKGNIELTVSFFRYGRQLKAPDSCDHSWVHGQSSGYYCLDCMKLFSEHIDSDTAEGTEYLATDIYPFEVLIVYDGYFCIGYDHESKPIYCPTEAYGEGYKVICSDTLTFYIELTEQDGVKVAKMLTPDFMPMVSFSYDDGATVDLYSHGVAVYKSGSLQISLFYDYTFDSNMIFELNNRLYEFKTVSNGSIQKVN